MFPSQARRCKAGRSGRRSEFSPCLEDSTTTNRSRVAFSYAACIEARRRRLIACCCVWPVSPSARNCTKKIPDRNRPPDFRLVGRGCLAFSLRTYVQYTCRAGARDAMLSLNDASHMIVTTTGRSRLARPKLLLEDVETWLASQRLSVVNLSSPSFKNNPQHGASLSSLHSRTNDWPQA